MELNVRKSDLLHELQLCQGIVERKNTIPILSNVLLEADEDGGVDLLATDLDVTLRSRCGAVVARPGSVTVPAKKLFEIVRNVAETDIRICEETKGSVTIEADEFSSKLQTLPREDFPTLPEVGGGAAVSVERAAMREMVVKTAFAITGEDTRFYLNGALFVVKSHAMSLIATDGHRLALATTPRNAEESQDELTAILPKKTLSELTRLLSEGEGDVSYSIGESHLFFEVDGRHLISRKIDATFPTYERVIPTGNDKRVEIDRDRLTSAVRRVALLSNDRSHAMKFNISAAPASGETGGKAEAAAAAEVSAESPEHGRAREIVPIDYAGPDLVICFNAQYVLDFLGVVDAEAVTLELKDETSQAVMHPSGNEADYTYVIMPMRV